MTGRHNKPMPNPTPFDTPRVPHCSAAHQGVGVIQVGPPQLTARLQEGHQVRTVGRAP